MDDKSCWQQDNSHDDNLEGHDRETGLFDSIENDSSLIVTHNCLSMENQEENVRQEEGGDGEQEGRDREEEARVATHVSASGQCCPVPQCLVPIDDTYREVFTRDGTWVNLKTPEQDNSWLQEHSWFENAWVWKAECQGQHKRWLFFCGLCQKVIAHTAESGTGLGASHFRKNYCKALSSVLLARYPTGSQMRQVIMKADQGVWREIAEHIAKTGRTLSHSFLESLGLEWTDSQEIGANSEEESQHTANSISQGVSQTERPSLEGAESERGGAEQAEVQSGGGVVVSAGGPQTEPSASLAPESGADAVAGDSQSAGSSWVHGSQNTAPQRGESGVDAGTASNPSGTDDVGDLDCLQLDKVLGSETQEDKRSDEESEEISDDLGTVFGHLAWEIRPGDPSGGTSTASRAQFWSDANHAAAKAIKEACETLAELCSEMGGTLKRFRLCVCVRWSREPGPDVCKQIKSFLKYKVEYFDEIEEDDIGVFYTTKWAATGVACGGAGATESTMKKAEFWFHSILAAEPSRMVPLQCTKDALSSSNLSKVAQSFEKCLRNQNSSKLKLVRGFVGPDVDFDVVVGGCLPTPPACREAGARAWCALHFFGSGHTMPRPRALKRISDELRDTYDGYSVEGGGKSIESMVQRRKLDWQHVEALRELASCIFYSKYVGSYRAKCPQALPRWLALALSDRLSESFAVHEGRFELRCFFRRAGNVTHAPSSKVGEWEQLRSRDERRCAGGVLAQASSASAAPPKCTGNEQTADAHMPEPGAARQRHAESSPPARKSQREQRDVLSQSDDDDSARGPRKRARNDQDKERDKERDKEDVVFEDPAPSSVGLLTVLSLDLALLRKIFRLVPGHVSMGRAVSKTLKRELLSAETVQLTVRGGPVAGWLKARGPASAAQRRRQEAGQMELDTVLISKGVLQFTALMDLRILNVKFDPALLQAIQEWPRAPNLTALDLTSTAVGDFHSLGPLYKLMQASALSSLELRDCHLAPRHIFSLAPALGACSSLTYLGLAGNTFTESTPTDNFASFASSLACASSLASAIATLSRLQSLDISDVQLNDSCLRRLLQAAASLPLLGALNLAFNRLEFADLGNFPPSLRALNLSFNVTQQKQLPALFRALDGCHHLASLDLRGNQLHVEQISQLMELARGIPSLEVLNGIPHALEHTHLRWLECNLDLSARSLADADMAILAPTLAQTHLTFLDLSANSLGPEGMRMLARGLQRLSVLKGLDLSSNRLGSAGADVLAAATEHTTSLRTLRVSGNALGPEGARAVSWMLPSLQDVGLACNDLGGEGVWNLDLFCATSLLSIDLNFNGIDSDGVDGIVEALPCLKTLRRLSLVGNRIPLEAAAALVHAMSPMQTALGHARANRTLDLRDQANDLAKLDWALVWRVCCGDVDAVGVAEFAARLHSVLPQFSKTACRRALEVVALENRSGIRILRQTFMRSRFAELVEFAELVALAPARRSHAKETEEAIVNPSQPERNAARKVPHESRKEPDGFRCPITHCIMRYPVMATDGHSYEKTAIEKWLKNNNTSPKTNDPLSSKQLIPNHTLRNTIEDWMEDQGRSSELKESQSDDAGSTAASVVAVAAPLSDSNSPGILGFFGPQEKDGLEVQKEADELQDVLSSTQAFSFHPFHSPSLAQFEAIASDTSLLDHVRIVHLAGHADRQSGIFVLGSEVPTEAVTPKLLKLLLATASRVECVVLNTCRTEEMGQELRRVGVRNVVCWSGEVEDGAALSFAKAFYQRLAGASKSRPYWEAFTHGRIEVDMWEQSKPTVNKTRGSKGAVNEQSGAGQMEAVMSKTGEIRWNTRERVNNVIMLSEDECLPGFPSLRRYPRVLGVFARDGSRSRETKKGLGQMSSSCKTEGTASDSGVNIEAAELYRVLNWKHGLDLEWFFEPTFDAFQAAVVSARSNVKIIHLAGHTNEDKGFALLSNPQPERRHLTSSGESLFCVNADDLAEQLAEASISRGGAVECVVLNANNTLETGRALRRKGFRNVICWDGRVADGAAVEFTRAFYSQLLCLMERQAERGSEARSNPYTKAFYHGRINVGFWKQNTPRAGRNAVVLLSESGDVFESTRLQNLSTTQLCDWVEDQFEGGCYDIVTPQAKVAFLEKLRTEGIDGETVITLDDSDLQKFGLVAMGPRRKLLIEIKKAFPPTV